MERYSRQILFTPIGSKGQERLSRGRVVVVGCGALGGACAETLARAGVGHLRLIDRDWVEESNLTRQSLFNEEQARQGLPKAEAARRSLAALNSQVVVEGLIEDLSYRNAATLLAEADLIIDGSDNFETRFLINDYSVDSEVPWIYGGALASQGTSMAIDSKAGGPCLRCLLPKPPARETIQTCEDAGILGPAVQAAASFQASQALRRLTGHPFQPVLLKVDVWSGRWRTVSIQGGRSATCPCCAERDFAYLEGRAGDRAERLCGRQAVQLRPTSGGPADLERLGRRLEKAGEVILNPFLLRFRKGDWEIALFRDGRAIVRGTDDPTRARAFFARYVG